MNDQTPVTPYIPEKPDHIRTAVKTLITLLIFHGLSLAFHFMVMGNSDPYTMSGDAASRIPTAMFLFSIVALFVLGDLLVGVYFKDGKRKRAFLDATSAEKRGERLACLEARRHMAWYLRGVPYSGAYKSDIVKIETLEDMRKIANRIKRELR